MSVARHVTAGLGTAAANLGADLHFIAIKSFARYRAGFANLGAGGAFRQMMLRSAHHEISRRLTGLNTIVHQQGMMVRHMFATLIEAVVEEGILADITALPAQFDANLDMFGMISHGKTPYMTKKLH
jgi:hypothetical protein